MKIAFIIKAMGNKGGGAEKVLVDVASGLANRGHKITIITSDAPSMSPYYSVDKKISRVFLGIGDVTKGTGFPDLVKRIVYFNKTIRECDPDVAVAFMHSTYIPAGIALLGTGIPLVASEHISPEHYRTRAVERFLLNIVPLLTASITVVSEQIRKSFGHWLRRKMIVIPNPVTLSKIEYESDKNEQTFKKKTILSVGRLSPQKNQACLISAFSIIAKDFPEWKLRIVGEGELRRALELQINDLGLADRIELPGAVRDIGKEYLRASFFVTPSTYESFGLATAEALLYKLPALGFEDCPGTNVLIRDQENGILVSGKRRIENLSYGLAKLMNEPNEIARLSQSSTDWVYEEFGLEGVLDKWEELVTKISESK